MRYACSYYGNERRSMMAPVYRTAENCLTLCALLCVSACLITDHEVHHECKEVRNGVCTNHFGRDNWYGRFPNSLGLDEDESSVEFYNFFALLYQDNYCSHLLIKLLCFHYFPLCSPECPNVSLTPSRQLCAEAVDACLPYARVLYGETFNNTFPKYLNCSNFPDAKSVSSDLDCLMANSTIIEPCHCDSDDVHIDYPNPSRFPGCQNRQ